MSNDPDSSKSPESAESGSSWVRKLGRSLTGAPRNQDDIIEFLRDAQREAVLDGDAVGMIQGVLSVGAAQVRDIMIPRAQMVVLERDAKPTELLTQVIQSGHSRFPVIGDNKDEVVGVLLAKDLLRLSSLAGGSEEDERLNLGEVLRPAVFVPESKRLNMLLKDFRTSRNHMAIVVDEYGGVAGLVTIEDVLEQIVGEIDDEYDEAEGAYILKLERDRYQVRALTPIDEFNRYFSSSFSDEEFDTIGGLVMHEFGHMPKRGESTTIGRFLFTVQRADNRRIHLLQISVLPEQPTSET